MAEEPIQVERHIDSTRREFGENIHELEHRVKKATDWRAYIEKKPLTALTFAFAGGILISGLLARTGKTGSRHPLGESGAVTPHAGVDSRKHEAAETLDTIKGAMIGWAANQCKLLLTDILPGFGQEYERTASEKRNLQARSRESMNFG